MDTFAHLALGFQVALQPFNLLMLFFGVALGLVIGVLPGLGGTSGVAILLPVTVFVPPTSAVIFLCGIYWGALFGGVVTTILFNIPGEPWSVALLFDGFPLAKQKGRPGLALSSSFVASFVGALVATVLFTFFAVLLADWALAFGPPELFAVFLLAFATLTGLESGSPLKSIAMIGLGLLLASIGFDTVTGAPRLTFGRSELLGGIGFVPVTIGLFGIGELLASAEEQGTLSFQGLAARVGLTDVLDSIKALRDRIWLVLGTTLVGFWIGVLPGTGATPASFIAYGLARSWSKDKEDFGKGEISGIMAPQSSADAAGVGSILPMIALGVPGSPTAAVIMAGLFIWGLQPGPQLFITNPDFVWGLIASIYLGQLLTFTICILGVPLLASIMRVPYAIMTPFIVVISILGSYSLSNSMTDVWITLIFGLVGFWLRKQRYPMAPLVVAIVLGDSMEKVLRQSLIMSDASLTIFFTRPIALVTMIAAIGLFALPVMQGLRRRRLPSRQAA
ncbi:MAG: tripartite tricarboxylate transporter permease [Chloroflexi bacterium]|nr:tripartite tricarboxylate transporter permease [Chloroflexota bacterium]